MTVTQDLRPDALVEFSRGTVDYVTGTVTDRNGNNLAMGVELAITLDEPPEEDAGEHDWLPATWTGGAGPERGLTTTDPVELDATTYPSDRYGVYVRLDNDPAHPVFRIGTLVITD